MAGVMHVGTCVTGETATESGGTHPTGMHSCFTDYLTLCDGMADFR